MRKIVIDARESGTTTGRYIDKLIEYLHKIGPEFEIVLLAKAHRLKYLRDLAPGFKTIETPYKEFTFGEQLGFKRQIDKLHADLVFFPMVQQPVFYQGKVVTTMQDLTSIRFKNPTKNPVIYTIKQQVYKWVNKRAAKKSATLITPSEFVKQDVVDYTGVKPDKITVTYEAADAIADKPEPVDSLIGASFIMYVGRPMLHKNLPRLIEAFKQLKSAHPELKLVLAGKKDALYRAIEQDVQSQNLSDVVFTDFVSEGQLRWLYEHCAAYVFPSLSEGFGLPPLEAMQHGAPVVSSNATCLPEINGDAAHYFDPLDVQAMADAISEVLTDKNLRAKLVTAGYVQVKKYSWEKMARQTLGIYMKVLNEK